MMAAEDSPVVPVCPPGFDCAYVNSCPEFYVDCPRGYFCSSYQGFKDESQMDLRFAEMKEYSSDVEVTNSNKLDFIDPDRAIQTKCLLGFFCSSYNTMEACPEGYWCSESTVEPMKCDPLSICYYNAAFQTNFMNTLLAGIFTIIVFFVSSRLVSRQKKRNATSRMKDPSRNATDGVESAMHNVVDERDSFQPTKLINISFDNLYYAVKDAKSKGMKDRIILPKISGHIPEGKMTVLLGPTGCGKSTLLNLIRNGGGTEPNNGKVTVRMVENHRISFSERVIENKVTVIDRTALSSYVGYVPQEDILDRDLTIRELLTFNALARVPGLKPGLKTNLLVDQVLSDLAIQHVADSIIGGGENLAANISGGQLKRVNIACELVALSRPAVLLLDEPTAGLDAAIAYELVQTLDAIVQAKGITICMILQQPRAEIFERIHHLFLMDSHGAIVYEGKPSLVVTYLGTLGYEPGEETSDADFCVDVLNGLIEPSPIGGSSKTHTLVAQHIYGEDRDTFAGVEHALSEVSPLALAWKSHCENMPAAGGAGGQDVESGGQRSPKRNGGGGGAVGGGFNSSNSSPKHLQLSSKSIDSQYSSNNNITNTQSTQEIWATFYKEFMLNTHRLLIIRLRNRTSLLVYFSINIIMAIALSSGFSILMTDSYLGVLAPPTRKILQAYYPSPMAGYASDNVNDLSIAQLVFFMASALGCASSLAAVPVFAGQRSLIHRERNAGLSVYAYACGRMWADMVFVLFNGFVFAGIWMLFGHAGSYYSWLAVILATAFASSAIGYISSAINTKNNASVYAIIATFVCCVFSGSEPTLQAISRLPVVSWPWYLSFATWTSEATYITWSSYLNDDGEVENTVQEGADHYGYSTTHGIRRSIGTLIALGIAMRIVAIVILNFITK